MRLWGQRPRQLVAVTRERKRGFEVDHSGTNQFCDFAVETLHAFSPAGGHGLAQEGSARLTIFESLPGLRRCLEDFNGRHSTTGVHSRNEALRNDVAECFGEAASNRTLFPCSEGTHNSIDGFDGIYGIDTGQ